MTEEIHRIHAQRQMEIDPMGGWYYLHQNGSLIYKSSTSTLLQDLRESSFVVGIWPAAPLHRENLWGILVEALAAGARDDVYRLAADSGCTDDDAQIYADRVGLLLCRAGDEWCAMSERNLKFRAPFGFGEHPVDAFAALARVLGYRPSKNFWTPTFKDLVKGVKPEPAKLISEYNAARDLREIQWARLAREAGE